jgi:hypothetical protein
MKKITLLSLLSLIVSIVFADNIRYSVISLDTQLLKNANAIVRLEEIRYEVLSTKETVTKTHFVITVLNEKGIDYAGFEEMYDKQQEITSIDGYLYDAFGKELKTVKKKDIQDLSAVSDGQMYTDNRVKVHNFYYKVYPYTVEYVYEVKRNTTLFFPGWTPQPAGGISVEKSIFTVAVLPAYKLRYKSFNYNGGPEIKDENKFRTYTWSASKIKPIIKEPNAPLLHELTTMVITGPSAFQMDDYTGNMETWQDFGRFVYELKKGRDLLPDNIKDKVHTIGDAITDKRVKIARLYEFMQQQTRYVGVQLGIGGWQPFDAKYVAGNGYGDCKALTNYMYSILKEAGIPSYYTLIKAGRYQQYITEDFPAQQFNHVILSVPLEKDTVWLECTDQTMPAGYLGYFTCNRPALMIDEKGGKLVRTPAYGVKENIQVRKITGTLTEDGNLQIKTNAVYGGLQQDRLHDLIHLLSKEKLKDKLQEEFEFATYDITGFNYQEHIKKIPEVEEKLDINVSNYATITGKRLFIQPNILTKSSTRITPDSTRKYDIVLNYAYTDIDTAEIVLPPGYTAESLPKPANIHSPFGSYISSVTLTDSKLVYYRKLEKNEGRFPAASYADLVKFYEAIYKADRTKVVLVK